jgi:Ca-activated chloride channel homolog
MSFANPNFLYGLLIVPLLVIFLRWAGASRRKALNQLGELALVRRLNHSVNWRGRQMRSILWLLGISLVIVAMARPQWGSQVRVVEQEGIQMMVVLDVSKSMLAEDIKPNRLTRAKLEISDLMDRLGGDEIGLVLFSGASFVQFPLTSDYNTARSFLNTASPNSISRPGTELGDAIKTAMTGYDEMHESQKVMLILTDGENHQADVLTAAEEAAEAGIMIYTIGFGSQQGEPIPDYGSDGNRIGYLEDQNGQVVLSRLDEDTLREIAKVGKGKYYRARADGSELSLLILELEQLEKAQMDSRFETTKIERFQIFLAGAVVALLVGEWIPLRRRETKSWQVWWSDLSNSIRAKFDRLKLMWMG